MNLTDLIEMIKDYNLKKKPIIPINVESMKRAREEEMKNSDKMARNLYHEYEKYQKRFEKVSDPMYANDLRRKVSDLDSIIKTVTKEQRTLQIN